ncbi:MAG: hypothetical protein MRT15_04230 [archaeon YNP-LCB-003-016]|uniref:hypothetical protein n=1 Tax=Candidatus Culexarchaeum yellowstonense TaxID=2928963 RepID=UPI0026F143B3|nr:hypothetical protein [Candidatus Culexarchaeum yellowstonense]MCR6691576.1 hypothetical protein [Candidatus Culexarchaeum yellowstonense]
MEDFSEVLVRLHNFLPSLPTPRINYNCEYTCPMANECNYLGCYVNGTINLKSYATPDVLVHEYGHYIFHKALGYVDHVESEKFARWFEKSFYNPVICEECGSQLIYNSSEAFCPNCGTQYYSSNGNGLIGAIGKAILVGLGGTLLGGFITGMLPGKAEPLDVKMDKIRKLTGMGVSTALISFIAGLL